MMLLQRVFICLAVTLFLLEFAHLWNDGGSALRGTSLPDAADLQARQLQEMDEPSAVLEWPIFHRSAIVPTGTYTHAGRNTTSSTNYGRVLLYVTSHFSKQHEMFLRYCWKNQLARSPLLQEADVTVFLNPNNEKERGIAMEVFKDTFVDHDMVVHLHPGNEIIQGVENDRSRRLAVKKTGAVMAIYDAVTLDYFDGYDWVIRVNPDVLIRDDSLLRESMANPDLSALLIDCRGGMEKLHVPLAHTDFFMIKPEVLLKENNPKEIIQGAEQTFTASIQNTVFDKIPRVHQWIPGAHPASRTCRAGEGKDFFDSPIIHEHALHPDICSVPEADMPIIRSAYLHRWPQKWKPA